jgi:transposase, IS5 family
VARVIARTGRRPRTVTADRGYGEASVDHELHELTVRTVVIPRKGSPDKTRQALEHRAAFHKTVKWRTGSKGRISSLTVSTAPGCVRGWSSARCPQGC